MQVALEIEDPCLFDMASVEGPFARYGQLFLWELCNASCNKCGESRRRLLDLDLLSENEWAPDSEFWGTFFDEEERL